MDEERGKEGCSATGDRSACCRVESIVSVDDRGQMVLPKELRQKSGIRAGDKLAVVSWEKDGRVCCIFLMRAEELVGGVKDVLGPLLVDMLE